MIPLPTDRTADVLEQLPEPARLIIDSIIDGEVAWSTVIDLAFRTRLSIDATFDALAELESGGWLATWEPSDARLVITFTPAGASALRVRLVEGPDDLPRWARSDQPDPPPSAPSPAFRREEPASWLDLVVDPNPGPDELAEAAEESPLPRVGFPGLPRPTVLVGADLTPWPGPMPAGSIDPCPACHGLPLWACEYCLVCDRWGLDDAAGVAAPPRSPRPPVDPKAVQARLKAKQRAKRAAQEHAAEKRRKSRKGGKAA